MSTPVAGAIGGGGALVVSLSKLGVLRLGSEYLHPGSLGVGELFEAARAALPARFDFSGPLRVLRDKHMVESVADIRLLIVENQLRELGLPIRLCVWLEEEVAKLAPTAPDAAASANAAALNVSVAAPAAAPLPPIPLSTPVRPRHTAGLLSAGADGASSAASAALVAAAAASVPSSSSARDDKVAALFVYSSDFDTNGLLYYLGTRGRTAAWSNPTSAAQGPLVQVSCAPGLGKDSAELDAIVGREVVRCVTGSAEGAFIQVDFSGSGSSDFWLRPSAYTVRHYASYDSECLRDWKLEGSSDGGRSFTLLKEHRNDCNLSVRGGSATWKLDLDNPRDFDRNPAPKGGAAMAAALTHDQALAIADAADVWPPRHWYKSFRLTMLGPNSNAHLYLACSGLEFYGAVLSQKQMDAWQRARGDAKAIPSWSVANDPPWPLPAPFVANNGAPSPPPVALVPSPVPEDTDADLLEDDSADGPLAAVNQLSSQLLSLSFTDGALKELVASGALGPVVPLGVAAGGRLPLSNSLASLSLGGSGAAGGVGNGFSSLSLREGLFTYSSDFDRNGMIWALATANSTRPWTNPADAGLIKLHASSLMDDSVPLSAIVGRDTVRCVTKPIPSSWVVLDFLADKKVLVSHYSLKHYSSWDSEALRCWRIECSNTGAEGDWTVLREHVNDENLNGKGGTFTWSISGADRFAPARFLRIIQTAENSNKHHYLALSGLELYGRLLAADGVKPYSFGAAPAASASASASLLPAINAVPANLVSGSVHSFTYRSDFDRNGLFYFLGSAGHTRAWINPVESGLVRAAASSLNEDSEPLSALVGHATVRCVSQPIPEQWMALDLGPGRMFLPTAYTLRHYASWDTEALRNWRLQGSNDAVSDMRMAQQWTTLLEHREDESLSGKGSTHTWNLPSSTRFWRMFRIMQYDKNSNKHHYLACSGWEMYGTLKCDPPIDFGPVSAAATPILPLAVAAAPSVPVVPMRPASLSSIQVPQALGLAPAIGGVQQPYALAQPSALLQAQSSVASGSLDVWDSVAHGSFLQVTAGGSLVRNGGSADKWQLARGVRAYSSGVHKISVRVVEDPATTNTWRFILGVVPSSLDCQGPKQWVGVAGSWGYISGTGGKCHSTAVSVPYGSKFGRGDVMTLVLNFDAHTLSFYRNDEPQGVAFTDLAGEVHLAASLTATESALQIVPTPPTVAQHVAHMISYSGGVGAPSAAGAVAPRAAAPLMQPVLAPLAAGAIGGSLSDWDAANKSLSLAVDPLTPSLVRNTGSADKWQSVRSVRSFSGVARSRHRFDVTLVDCPRTNNSWQVIVGVVPASFTCQGAKQWVGAGDSWGYIGGTGGKCFSVPKSVDYGAKFGSTGDVISVTLDFQAGTVEFAKNGVSQGVAFTNLTGTVYAAVSLTATGATAKLTVHP